jgi:hypothetical protein
MKRLLLLVVVITLFAVPQLLACESCVPAGSRDPMGGGPYSSAICWTSDSGQWSWCVGGSSNCTGDDPENVCPVGTSCPPDSQHCGPIHKDPLLTTSYKGCDAVDEAGRCAGKRQLTPSL